ncbi:sialidase family protein [Myroides sp. LJL110]
MNRSLIFFFSFLCGFIYGQSSKIIYLKGESTTLNQKYLIDQFSNHEQEYFLVDQKKKYKIIISEPSVVFQADKPEEWGYIQFPSIQITERGDYLVMWNLSEDKIGSALKKGWKYSTDKGDNWFFNWRRKLDFIGDSLGNNYYIKFGNYTTKVNGREKIVKSYSVNNKNVNLYENNGPFSVEIYRKGFNEKDFVKGMAHFDYNNLVYGYSIDGFIPYYTWGKVDVKGSNEIYKIQYPVYLKEFPNYASIAWLYSGDNGYNWTALGFIPFSHKEEKEVGNYISNIQGFDEATFVRYNNDNLLAVVRTTTGLNVGPLLQFTSDNNGEKWGNYKVISPNGVFPQLLKLNSELTVLSYGRPGVQLRFSNSLGDTWSDPLNLLRFEGIKGQVSCGYTGMLKIDDNSFIIVYSDFKTKDIKGEIRKSIITRKIRIDRVK